MRHCKMALLSAAVLFSACKSKDEAASEAPATVGAQNVDEKELAPPAEPEPLMEAEEKAEGGGGVGFATVDDSADFSAGYDERDGDSSGKKAGGRRRAAAKPKPGAGGGGGESGPSPRSWFPETFLFEPLVVTDDSGRASVSVRVPDRLTTWRVLGLAHSRGGSQAGAVTRFLGTLPVYVDPVVPPFVRAGDTVRLPIQVVNTTDGAVNTSLSVTAKGASLRFPRAQVLVPPGGSVVRYAELTTVQPGEVVLSASLGSEDAVVRTIDVVPTGKLLRQTVAGTLAEPRTRTLSTAAGDGARSTRVTLVAFPGALALLRSELGRAGTTGGIADDAFSLLLAGEAPELLSSMGQEPDAEALRTLSILSTQKVVRHARVLDETSASLIARAAQAHPENPVLQRLGERAVATIEAQQAPDGTCGGESGWTLQRLLVATAECALAAKDSPNVRIRAGGAFERYKDQISDPYTAAAILASGAVSGALADQLRDKVMGALADRDDGSKKLELPEGVMRPDGQAPSEAEATAMAILALDGAKDAPMADLGATILATYSPYYGWGDGRANLAAMYAAMVLFREPVPESTRITLSIDGESVAEGALDRNSVRGTTTLEARGVDVGGSHEYQIKSEPAVPGLGFSLAVDAYIPWPEPAERGMQIAAVRRGETRVGQATTLDIKATVPSGEAFEVTLNLPAGVQSDVANLDELVAAGTIHSYEQADGRVTLRSGPLPPAETFAAAVRVIPTLAGSVQSGAMLVKAGENSAFTPPERWDVR